MHLVLTFQGCQERLETLPAISKDLSFSFFYQCSWSHRLSKWEEHLHGPTSTSPSLYLQLECKDWQSRIEESTVVVQLLDEPFQNCSFLKWLSFWTICSLWPLLAFSTASVVDTLIHLNKISLCRITLVLLQSVHHFADTLDLDHPLPHYTRDTRYSALDYAHEPNRRWMTKIHMWWSCVTISFIRFNRIFLHTCAKLRASLYIRTVIVVVHSMYMF